MAADDVQLWRRRIAEGVEFVGVATDTSVINRGAKSLLQGLLKR